MVNWRILASGAAALALAVPAHAAGYLKIPDIDGETQRQDNGETRHRYTVVVTSSRVVEGKSDGKVGPVRWMAPESTRDAGSGMATGKRQHGALTTTKEVDKASPDIMRSGDEGTSATKYKRLTMKRGTMLPPKGLKGPGSVAVAAKLPGCSVGKRYPYVLIGDEGGKEAKLMKVTVAQCASEEFTLNYEHIQRKT